MYSPRLGRLASFLLLALSAFIPVNARAQDATELVKQGVELRREGHDAEALAVFERALAADGSPRTRAQVALAEQALGFWVEAERDLSGALAAGDGPWFVQHRETLNAALEAIRRRLATLTVEVNVDGAELWINGVRAGTTPLSSPVRVAAGSVAVEARANGYSPQTHRLEVAPETETDERLELAPLPVAAHVESSGAPEPAAAEPVRPLEPYPTTTSRRTGAWFSFGAAAALGIGGTAALLVRNDNATVYNDDGRCFYGTLTRDQRCGSYRDTATIAGVLAIVQLAAAGGGLAAGTYLFLSEPKDRHRQRGSACSFGVGVTCEVTF